MVVGLAVGLGLLGLGVAVGVATCVVAGVATGVGTAVGAGVEAGVGGFRSHWYRSKTAALIKAAVRHSRAPNRAGPVADPLRVLRCL